MLMQEFPGFSGDMRRRSDMSESYIFLGDSLTEGGNWNELLPGKTVLNFGVGGNTTLDILTRISQLDAYPDNDLYFMAGINDLGNGREPDEIIVTYGEIIDHLLRQSPDRKVFLLSLLPVSFEFSQHSSLSIANILKLNDLIHSLSLQLKLSFINLFNLFSDKNGIMQEKYTYDGLHLNLEGYKCWSDLLLENYLN